jgi:hypothetical protein
MAMMGSRWAMPGWLLLAGFIALFVGAMLATMPVQGAVVLLALGGLLGILVAPWPVLLVGFLVTVAFVVGPLQYAGGVGKAFWLPYLMGVLMGVRVLTDGLGARAHKAKAVVHQPSDGPMRAGWMFMGLLGLLATMSSVAHGVGILQAVVAGKEYLFLWSLPLAFSLGLLNTNHLRRLWQAMSAWLALQAVVVVWQRVVVAPRRGGDAPWDAVVGLFAGKANGAGGSGTMAMVSLWAAACVLMAWRAGLAGGSWALLAAASVLVACALAEVKLAVLLLPMLAAVVLYEPSRHVKSMAMDRPLRAMGGIGVLCISLALMWAHQQQFSVRGSADAQSSVRYAQTVVERNLDTQWVADEHGQLTRLGALQYWWTRQSVSDIPGWMIGHGIGAVRRSNLSPGSVVRGLRIEPGRSSAVILLWETGVLGLVAWVGFSLAWMLSAVRLMAAPSGAHESVCLKAAFTIIGVTLLSLPYGADLFEAPHLAVAYLLGVGIVWGVHRQRRQGNFAEGKT